MYRYLAVIWNPAEPPQSSAVRELTARLKAEFAGVNVGAGLVIGYTSGGTGSFQAYDLNNGAGVVLGRLFYTDMHEDAVPLAVRFDSTASRELLASRGRNLLERYWGQYVAFINDGATATVLVIRDPTAAVPCYIASHSGMTFVFSDVSDYFRLTPATLSINWRYVCARLLNPFLHLSETGITEISMLRGGERLELRRGLEYRRTSCWDIARTAVAQPIEDLATAVTLARTTVRSCVAAWAARHSRISLRLSGGLDSSVVLACLLRAPSRPEVTCVNYFDSSSGNDERYFARVAAQTTRSPYGAHYDLIEYERDPNTVPFDSVFDVEFSACPSVCLHPLIERALDQQVMREHGDIIFTGLGGDAIFCRLRDESPAIDYVHRHGLGRQLPRIAHEVSRGAGSFWSVLRHAVQQGLLNRNQPCQWEVHGNSLASADIRKIFEQRLNDYMTPAWAVGGPTRDALKLSAGKLRHIESMSVGWHVQDCLKSMTRVTWAAPLASQPILELFARMPLYLFTSRAEDRAVTRRAFAGDLSPELLARRSKAGLTTFSHRVIRRHWKFLREFMLDGILVERGLLSAPKLEALFSRPEAELGSSVTDLFCCFDVEVWLRRWRHLAI